MNNILHAHFHVRIDAAGQYAVNLELFLRGLDLPMTISVGEPKRNKDYQKAHFPKRTTDDTESQAMARFAVVEQPDATPAPSAPMILLREVAGRLQSKVKQTTQAINRLHNLLARVFPELATLTEDIAAGWVLKLLDKYPTAERIAPAHLASLEKIPYLSGEQAQAVHQAAKQSVASLRGDVAEALVRDLVAQVRHCQTAEEHLRQLLIAAFADLPASPHVQVLTIPGIGEATAAALVAKIVDIDRFATPDHLVSYFGVFPEESSSGVDKHGKPLPPGTLIMSPQGQRSGPRLPLERRAHRHPAQPGHPRPLPPSQGQGQTRRRRDRPLHAQAPPPRLRRLEDRSPLRRGPLPLGGLQ